MTRILLVVWSMILSKVSSQRELGLRPRYLITDRGRLEYNLTILQHYIGNEQETNRNPGSNEQGEYTEAVSSNIDDKTMHELYLWPFQDAVLAGSASIMCSYQRVNNSYGCQNSKTLNGLLKTELGFQGELQ